MNDRILLIPWFHNPIFPDTHILRVYLTMKTRKQNLDARHINAQLNWLQVKAAQPVLN